MDTINSFDFLIALIKACHGNTYVEGPKGFDAKLGGSHYLLNQSIRQFWNQPGHAFVSKKALEKWNDLKVGDSIFKYYYQKPVYYKNEKPVSIKCFKGARNEPYRNGSVQYRGKKECFPFRQVFHVEHIVPINIIIDQLLNVNLERNEAEVYKKIDTILNKIYVCYILKEENVNLNRVPKNKRSDDYQQVLDTDYKKAGIEIKEYLTNIDS